MSWTLFHGSLQLGLIYGLLALGVYTSFRILNVPDLTTDGSFTLGLAVSAAFCVRGQPLPGILLAVLAGALAGALTGLFQTKAGIHPILAGILTMSGLYTVNLYVMGESSNLSLIGKDTLFAMAFGAVPGLAKNDVKLLLALVICLLALGVMRWFFRTHLGLCIRATGNNMDMVRSSSINVDGMKILALAIANGCVGLSGAVLAQYQGYADIGSGVGIVVIGLASVIIGEVCFGRRSVGIGFLSAVVGAILYRIVIAVALKSEIFPAYALKLVSAGIVAIALSLPALRQTLEQTLRKRKGMRHA